MTAKRICSFAVLSILLGLLGACRQLSAEWEFDPIRSALYEEIALLSSADNKVYLRRARATGAIEVSYPGYRIHLPECANPRVTQKFRQRHVDYAVLQDKDKAGNPVCMLVTTFGGSVKVFALNECLEETLQVHYTSKNIELAQPQTNPLRQWWIEGADTVYNVNKPAPKAGQGMPNVRQKQAPPGRTAARSSAAVQDTQPKTEKPVIVLDKTPPAQGKPADTPEQQSGSMPAASRPGIVPDKAPPAASRPAPVIVID
jgi:hypothetical protein